MNHYFEFYDRIKNSSYYKDLERYYESKGFSFLGQGGSRRTFKHKSGRFVIKIPHNFYGFIDNNIEALAYSRYRNGKTPSEQFLAPCRLLPNCTLMMKFVHSWKLDANKKYEKQPDFVRWCDGQQGGTYQDRIVLFDYAHDCLVERTELHKEYLWKK